MKRVAKPEGQFNVVIEEVDVPKIGSTEVLIRTERTLISRGSEIWRRYIRPEAIAHSSMGYSLVGVLVEVGAKVSGLAVGDRVAAACAVAGAVWDAVATLQRVSPRKFLFRPTREGPTAPI